MHIKRIVVEGFKTYKERTEIANLSPHHNVILGKNGSGKSNVYEAIQFVLSDKYSNIRVDERQRLLHEGSGREVISASVEIVFDNKDRRFPMDDDEIKIKRVIGLKKDEFFLNGQHSRSRMEVVSLLESAGMSRSNPYYIVQQGKLQSLIQMKDAERLELLKEIAGTRTYDERRKESLKIMTDTDNRRKQIEGVIGYIEQRLEELEGEKTELSAFEKLDRDRRCFEYTVYDKELKRAQRKLEANDAVRATSSKSADAEYNQTAELERQLHDTEEKIKESEQQLSKDHARMEFLENEVKTKRKDQARAEFDIKDADSKLQAASAKRDEAASEIDGLNEEVASVRAKLKTAVTTFGKKAELEEKAKNELDTSKARLDELYAKQGRSKMFSNKRERDTHLREQQKVLQEQLASQQGQLKTVQGDQRAFLKKQKALETTKAKNVNAMQEVRNENSAFAQKLDDLKTARDKVSEERKAAWREENELKGSLQGFDSELSKAKHALSCTMDKNLFHGIDTVKRLVEEHKIEGVHGMLLELFTVEPVFYKSVEATANNQLFNFVVDNDAIASRLIKLLNREKSGGRVTFTPLNRVKRFDRNYPTGEGESIPMITKLDFDEKYLAVMQQVFGKMLVTRNLEVAAVVARKYNFNAITLAGDKVNTEGAITGGYINVKASRMASIAAVKRAEEESQSNRQLAEDINDRVTRSDQETTRILGEMHKVREEKAHLNRQFQQNELEAAAKSKELENVEQALARKEKQIKTLVADCKATEESAAHLEAELGSAFQEGLSEDDVEELKALAVDIEEMKQTLLDLSTSRSTIESEKKDLENLLNNNLLKRKTEFDSVLDTMHDVGITDSLDSLRGEFSVVAEEARVLEEELRLVEVNIKNTMDVVKTQRATLESLKKDEDVGQGKLQKEAKSMERLLGKRTLQLQRIEECTRNIRELGSLPQEAFNTYAGWSDTKLMKRLEDTNRKLKKYGHVNKKAVEQFTGFVAQRTDLLKRQKEVDEGRKSIEDLIAHLDTKKDMGISRTFKSIALNFTEVFAKLVDGGKGKLTIQTRRTEEQEEKLESSQDSASESSSPAPSHRKRKLAEVAPEDAAPVSSYSGVGIRVSFTGSDEFQSMEQLSGGQQSIVALSLIFAIQKCDPSPFYLFDEIDSNLDTVHREKVASMILKECKTTQFITTTFRPEMLRRADRLYGVVFANRASKISEISREEAQQLVVMDDAQLNAQQQQRAERQTQPDSANSESSTHQHKRRRTTQQQGTSA